MGPVSVMRKKLVKHGNSRALIIDKPLLEVLEVGEDDAVDIRIVDDALVVSAARAKDHESDAFERALQRSLDKYANVYRRLAE